MARKRGRVNDGRNGGVQDPSNPLPWQLSDDDTPHVLLVGFTWQVPGPKQGVAGWILGGWNLAGILRYESGRPLTITMNNDLGGLLFNTQKRPNKTGSGGVVSNSDFDPFTDVYLDKAAWTDPGPLQFGNAPERDGDVRGPGNYSEDINIFKVFPVAESAEDPVRDAGREPVQPDQLLRAEHELELWSVRPGVHAVQLPAVDTVRFPVRLLARSHPACPRAGLDALPGGRDRLHRTARPQPTNSSSTVRARQRQSGPLAWDRSFCHNRPILRHA